MADGNQSTNAGPGESAEHSPLEQFEINRYIDIGADGGFDLSFTNSALMMVISVALISAFMLMGTRDRKLVPGRWQSMVELSYEFVANLIRDTIGSEGRRYFPIIFTIFMFVLFGNLLGMMPFGHYAFTYTSHIIVTFSMAIVIFLGVTVLGFARHGLHFFRFFVPEGVPLVMLLLLVPIEILSYLSRPVSLSVRLFANMLAGHTLLKVFAGFVPVLGIFGIVPFALLTALSGLEIVIAFLQAYVFAILTCLYINDALHMH